MKNTIGMALLLGASIFCLTSFHLGAQTSAQLVAGEGVPVSSLEKSALKDIFTGKTAYWDGGQSITIIVLKDKTDDALQDLTGMSAGSFRTFWQRLTFSGRGKQPKEADSVEKVLSLVAENKGAIALVPAGTPIGAAKKVEVK